MKKCKFMPFVLFLFLIFFVTGTQQAAAYGENGELEGTYSNYYSTFVDNVYLKYIGNGKYQMGPFNFVFAGIYEIKTQPADGSQDLVKIRDSSLYPGWIWDIFHIYAPELPVTQLINNLNYSLYYDPVTWTYTYYGMYSVKISDQIDCSLAGGDSDTDGVCRNFDNCPDIYNPGQEDYDNDGVGNVCDSCPTSADPSACSGNTSATVQGGSAIKQPGDPNPVTACFNLDRNGTSATFETFRPDCFNVVFNGVDGVGDPVDSDLCAYGPAYGIPVDLVPMRNPATTTGEYCVTCDLSERFSAGAWNLNEGDIKFFTLRATYSNYLQDPGCADSDSGTACSKLWVGEVTSDPINVVMAKGKTASIDIKPGVYPNTINLGSNGNVPVAILSTADFDATRVDPKTVTLADAQVKLKGKSDNPIFSKEDVNGDGRPDLIVNIATQGLVLTNGDTYATLKGTFYDAVQQKTIYVVGYDSVRVVP